jgi:hypothetical protein
MVSRARAIYAILSVANMSASVNNDQPCPRSSQHPRQSHRVRRGARSQLLLLHSRSPSPEFCLQGSHQAIEGLEPLLQVNKRKMRQRGIPLQTIPYCRDVRCRIQLSYPYQHLGREMLYKYRQEAPRTRILILLTDLIDASRAGYFFRKSSNFGRPPELRSKSERQPLGYDKLGNKCYAENRNKEHDMF